LLKCPVCGSDKILGEEGKFYCYDFEMEEIRPFNGLVIPHRTFHRVHGPFPALEGLLDGRVEKSESGVLLVYEPGSFDDHTVSED